MKAARPARRGPGESGARTAAAASVRRSLRWRRRAPKSAGSREDLGGAAWPSQSVAQVTSLLRQINIGCTSSTPTPGQPARRLHIAHLANRRRVEPSSSVIRAIRPLLPARDTRAHGQLFDADASSEQADARRDGAPRAGDARPPSRSRMRPRSLEEFVGQSHLLGEGSALRTAIEQGRPHSMVLYGPPGIGQDDARADGGRALAGGVRGAERGAGRARRGARRDRARRPPPRTASRRTHGASSSTRSTASTRPSRTRCCRPSRTG